MLRVVNDYSVNDFGDRTGTKYYYYLGFYKIAFLQEVDRHCLTLEH